MKKQWMSGVVACAVASVCGCSNPKATSPEDPSISMAEEIKIPEGGIMTIPRGGRVENKNSSTGEIRVTSGGDNHVIPFHVQSGEDIAVQLDGTVVQNGKAVGFVPSNASATFKRINSKWVFLPNADLPNKTDSGDGK
jgi:hypothetical protein